MPRKKKKKEIVISEEKEIIGVEETPQAEPMETEPPTPEPEDDGVEEISIRAKICKVLDEAPVLPDVASRDFRRVICANFQPEYERLLSTLRELAACLI